MVKKRRDVKEFKYPVEAKVSVALVDALSIRMLFKPLTVLWVFHFAMGLLLISGLVMDLAAPWISSFALRQFHGFAGAFFTIIFFVYISVIAINKNFRALRERINYVEIVFYAVLILFGLAIRYPTLLPFLGPISPFHCNLLTYGWVVVSTLGGGGIIQGVASIYYLFARARTKIHVFQGSKGRERKLKRKQFFDGFSRMQVLQLYACGKCGECILSCPIFEETQDRNLAPSFKIQVLKSLSDVRYGVRAILFGPQNVNLDEVKRVMASTYHCTLCGRCMTTCPYKFDLIELWETVREQAEIKDLVSELGALPTLNLLGMMKATVEEKNCLGRPLAKRKNWMRRLNVPEKSSAETLYFVGCAISYTPSLKVAAKGVTTILNTAKEDWTILSEEWCCGIPLKFGGETEHFKEFVTHNVETIEASGVKRVVFSCPGCYRMFKQEYPKTLGRPLKFSILHITELVNDFLKNGKIGLKKDDDKITYHDPCELARLLGIIEQPRSVLSELSTSFLELPENKVNTHCCGCGGLYKVVDTETSLEIAKKRIRQAEKIGSETLVSACPSCIMNLHQATRFMKSNIKILDFADIVAQQIENVS